MNKFWRFLVRQKDPLHFIFGLLVVLAVVGASFLAFRGDVIYWGDSTLCTYKGCFSNVIQSQLPYVWYDKASSGYPYLYQNYASIPVIIQFLLFRVVGSVGMSQRLFITFCFLLTYSTSFWVTRRLAHNYFLSLVVGLFYALNPWIIDRILMGHLGIWLGYGLLPPYLYLAYDYFICKRDTFSFRRTIVLALLFFSLAVSFLHIAYFSLLGTLIILVASRPTNRLCWIKIVFFMIISLLILAPLILPTVANRAISSEEIVSSSTYQVSNREEFDAFRDRNNLLKAFMFSGTFIDHIMDWMWSKKLFLFFFLGGIIFIVSRFIYQISRQKTVLGLVLFGAYLFLLFLAKGSSSPLSLVNYLFFDHAPLFKNLFRDANKFLMPTIILFCLMVIYSFKQDRWRLYTKLVLSFFIGSLVIAALFSGLHDAKGYGPQPINVKELEHLKAVEEIKREGRVLIYPGYTAEVAYSYTSSPVLSLLSINNKRAFVNYNQPGIDIGRSDQTKRLENSIFRAAKDGNIEVFVKLIRTENIDTIVYYPSVRLGAGNNYFSPMDTADFRLFVEGDGSPLVKVYETSEVMVYRLPTLMQVPHLSSENLTWEKLNPTHYRLHLPQLSNPQNLDFLSAAFPGWNLYVSSNNSLALDCSEKQVYDLQKTTECLKDQPSLTVSDVSYIFRKPLLSETKSTVLGYATRWNVDPSLLPPGSPEGVTLDLVYIPQSFYSLGFIIATLTIGIMIMLCLFEARKIRP